MDGSNMLEAGGVTGSSQKTTPDSPFRVGASAGVLASSGFENLASGSFTTVS